MKIAIPTRANYVDDHFGHCEAYTIFTIDKNNSIEKQETLPSPAGCGCKSNIASVLQNAGVGIMLAGNMGDGALNVLNYHGIDVYRGCNGKINDVVMAFLQGQVDDSGQGCHEHGQHDGAHQCNH
ncbi:MAG: dinitrogenase iron-molybdenum cofactor biosynthesis protein [Bacteroidetes bacterium GWF2_49_14]|nr:MAG: dinitrogenase iron-molybdenum cofactor biosynthesis protein [Bacteroidetes bacterium GWF2_49_14]